MNIKYFLIGSAAALALVCSAAYAASPGEGAGTPYAATDAGSLIITPEPGGGGGQKTKDVDIGAQAALGDEIGFMANAAAVCTDPGPKIDKIANLAGGPKAEKHPVLPWRFAEASGRHGKKPNLLVPAGGNKATEWDETLI